MRADEYLKAVAALPVRDFDAIAGPGGLVVMAPHQDDEALGCGGLLAEAAARGRDARVVFVSDGVGSHPTSKAYPPERLRGLREAEAQAAAAHLGLGSAALTFLRLPDRYVPGAGPVAEAAATRIAALARECAATSLFVTWGHDPHGDHVTSYAIAERVGALVPGLPVLAYTVWGWRLPPGTEIPGGPPRGARLDVGPRLPAKRAAVMAHVSQTTRLIDDDPQGFCLEPSMIEALCGPHEAFFDARPQPALTTA